MVKTVTPHSEINEPLQTHKADMVDTNLANNSLLTPNELKLWLNYIEHQVGFILPSSQQNWVQTTIERYLHQHNMTTTVLLATLSQDSELYHQLFDDILIPRTQFFRHIPTFKFIESYARQYALEAQQRLPNTSVKSFTAWSVGCSSGQEPVSVALSLAMTLGLSAKFRVFGSDFHQKSLRRAQQGQYNVSHLGEIPSRYQGLIERCQFEQQPSGKNAVMTLPSPSVAYPQKEVFRLKPELARRLSFFSYNLMTLPVNLPVPLGSCQLILCNNVLIYFRQFDQRDIINRLVDYLAEDGVLLLGVGELPNLTNPRLKKLPYPELNGFCKVNSPKWLEQLSLM